MKWLDFARWPLLLVLCLAVGLLIGCGRQSGSAYKTATVKGKVVYNGQPVTSGGIRFQPIEVPGASQSELGKPASGQVQSDGTFVLTTYKEGDGAVIGKHRVSYIPASKGAESYEDKPEPSPYLGLVPKEQEVEVKPGTNEITIELVPMGKRP